jgi:hypothetical protein
VDALKKNLYWVALGVLALVAGVLYGVAVAAGKNAEIAKAQRKLDEHVKELRKFANIAEEKLANPEEGMPVGPIVKYWQERGSGLEKEVQEIQKKYRARDKDFERLFAADAKNEVSYTDFVTALHKHLDDDLKGKYRSLIEEGSTFEKVIPLEDPKKDDDDAATRANIVRVQKQFYIVKAVAEAAKDAGARAITSMSFKEPDRGGPVGGKDALKEVERISCEVELKMPAVELPKLVSRLLRASVVFDIREIRVEAAPFTVPEFDGFNVFGGGGAGRPGGAAAQPQGMKGFEKDVLSATADQSNPKTKSGPPPLPEPAVGVKLVLHALDFTLAEGAEGGGRGGDKDKDKDKDKGGKKKTATSGEEE